MKTILHTITGLEPGGAEAVLLRMVTVLKNHRHVVVSLTTRGALAGALEQAGARVEALECCRPGNAVMAPIRLANILRRTRPDLIQSWLVHANVVSAVAQPTFAPAIPLVWNVRQSLDALEKEKWLTRRIVAASPHLARVPAAIIYNSEHSAFQHEQAGYPSARREIIANGFDTHDFAPRPESRLRVRSELGVEPEAILVGLVGRFHPVKNHAGFLEAAARVLETEPHSRFLLVGTGTETERLEPLVKSAALRARLIGLGPRSDIAKITGALDIACNVSHSEAFPNAVGEAMACAVPCVVTPVGESRRIVGDTGIVTDDTSSESIAEALLRMIRLGSDARADLGTRARKRVQENYSLSNAAMLYERLYDRLLANTRANPTAVPASSG